MSSGGNDSRKQVGTLFLDLSVQEKNIESANKLLKSIGAGINLDMSELVQKQVKQSLDLLVRETKKAAKEAQKAGKQTSGAFGGYRHALLEVEKATESWSGKMGKQQAKVIKGWASTAEGMKQVTKVFKNGTLSKVSVVDVDQTKALRDANKLYDQQSQILNRLYGYKMKLAKETDAGTISALREMIRLEEENLKQNREKIAALKPAQANQEKVNELKQQEALLTAQLHALENRSQSNKKLKEAQAAYQKLSDAQSAYMTALKRGDMEGMTSARAEMNVQMETLRLMESELAALRIDEATRQRILHIIEQSKNKINSATAATEKQQKAAQQVQSTMENIVSQALRWVQTMLVLNGMRALWRNATTYVQEYYDQLNEIRIVTMASEAEAEKMSETYLRMAKEMNVSSTEIATAAVEFWRQGQDESEVNSRLVETTKYAKIAGLEFDTAAELVTAATNSMTLSADRVVDVFAYLGDASASGADEIGTAMQKASASAEEFGLSFEWLGSYIATISEKTRQAPEVIGTSLNAVLARLHSIKSTGFNEEDETRINDVAKALNSVGVSIMDNQNQWRPFNEILEAVAEKWGTLDDKTKSYISTTMAGTRQQNYFLTLMNDMAKGIDGGSRAWELYAGALEAAGASGEKYAIWQESITAAQNNMKVSLEELYGLMNADWMKSFYNGAASFMNGMTEGLEATKGMSAVLPILGAGILVVGKSMAAAGGATEFFNAALAKNPFGLFLIAASSAVIIITQLAGAIKTTAERYEDAVSAMEDASKKVDEISGNYQKLSGRLEELALKTKHTKSEEIELASVLNQLAELTPEAAAAMEAYKNKEIDLNTALEKTNESLREQIELYKAVEKASALEAIENFKHDTSNDPAYFDLMTKDLEAVAAEMGIDFDGSVSSVQAMIDVFQKGNSVVHLGSEAVQKFGQELAWLEGEYEGFGSRTLANFMLTTAQKGDSDFEEWQNDQKNSARILIGHAMTYLQDELSAIEQGYFTEMLLDRMIGSDGILDSKEINQAKEWIPDVINEVLNTDHLFQDSKKNTGFLQYFVKTLFGKEAVGHYADEIESLANNSQIAGELSDMYEKMLELGLSEIDIRNVFDQNKTLGQQAALGQEGILSAALQDDFDVNVADYLFGGKEMDAEAMALVYSLRSTGVAIEEINEAAQNSFGLEAFKKNLHEISQETTSMSTETGSPFSTENPFRNAVEAAAEKVEEVREVISLIESGKMIEADMLAKMQERYSGLIAYVGDEGEMIRFLKEELVKEEAALKEAWMDWAAGSSGVMKESPYAKYLSDEIDTLAVLMSARPEMADDIEIYLEGIANKAIAATSELKEYQDMQAKISRAEELAEAAKIIDPANGEQSAEDQLAAYERLEKEYPELKEETRQTAEYIALAKEQTDANTASVNAEAAAWGVVLDRVSRVQAALAQRKAEQEGRTAEKLKQNSYRAGLDYIASSVKSASANGLSVEDAFDSAIEDIDSAGIQEEMVELFGDITVIAEQCGYEVGGIIAEIVRLKEEATAGELSDIAQTLREEREANRASSSGYRGELDALAAGYSEGGVRGLMDSYSALGSEIQSGLVDNYKSLAIAIDDANKAVEQYGEGSEEAAEANRKLAKELEKAKKQTQAKHFTSTAKAITELEHGTVDANDALETYSDEMESVRKANEEFTAASQAMAEGTEVAAEDLEALSEFMNGADPGWLIDNWNDVGFALKNALAEGEDAFRSLQEAAFINITGTSNVDFSDIENGLLTTEGMAQDTIDKLVALGMFKVEERKLYTDAWIWQGLRLVKKHFEGKTQVLVPTGNNPFKGYGNVTSGNRTSGGGSSGGGGSSSRDSGPSEVEKLLDEMEQIQEFQEHRKNLFSSVGDMYEGRGELTNAIKFYHKEKDAIEEQTKTLEANVAEVEKHMLAKQKEVAAMDTGDDAYEQAASDLKALQKTHQNYTLQLIENESAVEDLTEAIKKQQDAIRDMEIDLENTILEAIEDREALQKRMLQGTIDVENEIQDTLRSKYEKEREEILENAQLRKESLEKEKDQLDEQLEKRKELSAQQNKQKKLSELLLKLSRISADPTRKKEELELRREIAELREEIAWDIAEQETEAQKESLDEQINNVDDYMRYIEEYYEKLFSHPERLIEEMREIIKKSDEEILDWLKQNNQEYANSTEATRLQMENSWQEMLDNMRGSINTHWDEVQNIIQQGDEAIIAFLKANSADYKEASRLQAEAYVDEWKQKLEDLKKAFMDNAKEISSIEYETVAPSTGGGGSSGSGGGGSSKPRYITDSMVTKKQYYDQYDNPYFMYYYNNQQVVKRKNEDGEWKWAFMANGQFATYKQGGLVDYTGPAWVDGTKTNPEAFLNARQTELIGAFAKTLEQLRVSVPLFPKKMMETNKEDIHDTIQVDGDIVINVDKVETEEDISKMIEAIKATLYRDLAKSSVVGGIRIR